MPAIETLTLSEIATALGVVYDSHEQKVRMDNPDHPEAWMLDAVFDSKYCEALERRARQLELH